MGKVHIVTDTACDLPVEVLREKGIRVVPMTVNFPDRSYEDGVDLKPEEFYRLLTGGGRIPSTAQPTPQAFFNPLQEITEQGDEAVVITISTGMSGTYESVVLAREELARPEAVSIFDSKTASMGEGLIVLAAAEMAEAGKSREEIIGDLESMRSRLSSVFTLETLEYLQKGGRVSKLQAMAGEILNIKVILEVNMEGRIVPREKVRGRQRAVKRLLEIMAAEGRELTAQQVAVSHSQAKEEAAALAREIKDRFGVKNVVVGEITATVGTHVGPGCLALFFQR